MAQNPNPDNRKPSGREPSSQSTSSAGELSFRCKDAGYNDCDWQTRGRNEEEVFRNVERHGRETHNIQNFDDNLKNKVRSSIRRVAA
jgi:predicted small metal-binding protein